MMHTAFKQPLPGGLTLAPPVSCCCNCGTDSGLRTIKTVLRKTSYFILFGSETTLALDLPYCQTCQRSAGRNHPGLLHFPLIAAVCFLVFSLALLPLFEHFKLNLVPWMFGSAGALATVLTVLLHRVRRPRGQQTSYYQPMELLDIEADFLSGRNQRLVVRFSNKQYERLFRDVHREAIAHRLLRVR
jgi:hypothetical protein